MPDEVEFITSHIDDYYLLWVQEKINKETGELKRYSDGTIKKRKIRPSLSRLKAIQKNIKNRLLAEIPLPDNIHGGIRGRSNITNAKPHQGKKFRLTTDLQDFFPNVSYTQVYHALLSIGYTNHYAHWITKLTTWRFQVPQGAPTSTHITNVVFLKTDKKLIRFCEEHKLTYTRYIDDLTFSSQQDFKQLLNKILKIIIDGGFKINYRKTKYSGNETITGINIFNNYIDGPDKIKAKSIAERNITSGPKPYSNYLSRIRKTNKKMAG